jgi:Xaa-Pro aminopeptidase
MLIQEKINQAKELLKEFDIDCWITFVRESQINGDPTLAFLIKNDVTWHSAFIVSATGETRAIVGRYDQKSIEDTGAYDKVEGYVRSLKEPLQNYLKKLNPRKIALNYSESSEICDGITHGMYLTMYNYLDEIKMAGRIVPAERIVSALRERKSPAEIENIKQAIHITEEIFKETGKFIRPGKTENDVAEFMRNEVIARGLETAWDIQFCPSVFTGPNTAEAHFTPTDREIKKGHILNIDFGVKFNGYCSDMQRTFYILDDGEKQAPEEVQYGFNIIVKAIDEAKQAVFAGAMGMDVDAVGREVVITGNFDEFPHALGHQVGRYSHDGTALLGPGWEKYAQKPFQKLEKNMVFTIEPRLTVPDRGIVTMEEIILIGDDGAEYLSNPQTELILIKT